ncbi:MAG: urease accessory UreF family protein [Tepidisphaeraceae bacterium]|jgi:urease accessory protein
MIHANDLLILQLADSAFPSGGFAHSAGLEASCQQGRVRGLADLHEFIDAGLTSSGRSSGPLVAAAGRQPERLQELDRWADAMLANHVANRASRAQGRALLFAAERAFSRPSLASLRERMRTQAMASHLAPVLGATCGCLGLAPDRAVGLFMFGVLRGIVSAAVRLGIVGPMEAQAIQYEHSQRAASLAVSVVASSIQDIAQTSPMIELLQMNQDRLYSRLFQS